MNYWLYTVSNSRANEEGWYFLQDDGTKRDATVESYLEIVRKESFPEINKWHAHYLLKNVKEGDQIVIYGAGHHIIGFGNVKGCDLNEKEIHIEIDYKATFMLLKKEIKRDDFKKYILNEKGDITEKRQLNNVTTIDNRISELLFSEEERKEIFYNSKKKEVNQEERAFRAWNILYEVAQKRGTITYSDLAQKMNVHHRTCTYFLNKIQTYCMEEKLPPLTILVVSKDNTTPSSGFIAWDVDDFENGLEKVYENSEVFKDNPFEYAAEGDVLDSLVKDILNGDKTYNQVYARVKTRGQAQKFFRKALLDVYDGKCAFCDLNIESVLSASHILPWSEADQVERINPTNGILLCGNHHSLFDSGFLTINEDYEIEKGVKELKKNQFTHIDNIIGKKMNLPKRKEFHPDIENVRKKSRLLSGDK